MTIVKFPGFMTGTFEILCTLGWLLSAVAYGIADIQGAKNDISGINESAQNSNATSGAYDALSNVT